MANTYKLRKIQGTPGAVYFKPRGVPFCALEEIVLSLAEFEALRLAHFEGLHQEAAAVRMGISRQTFGNIICSARRKTADALVRGKALRIAEK